MKILWLSVAPWAPTGYGQQTAITVPRIKRAGHDIAISATNGLQYTEIGWGDDDILCYPADRTGLNKRMLRDHATRFGDGNADDVQVISLFDIWPWVDPAYGGMVADFKGLRIASWVPIDSYPLPPKTAAALDMFDVRPIAMSRFGEDTLREAGYDPLYAPHSIDTSVYKPEERGQARQRTGIPADRFVVGMVAHNEGTQPPRKSFPQVLQAFSVFAQSHPDALLFLHTDMYGMHGGINLFQLAEMFGIPASQVGYTNQTAYTRGNISPEYMALLYSSFDVLANPSYGEGFGVPIVEAQACGTPVIVSPWTAMKELAGPGWMVGGQPWYNPASGSSWWDASAEEILAAFELAYERRGDQGLRDECREFALGYDADKVFAEHWLPTLEALEKPREVPPLPFTPNRAARRRKEREDRKVAA